MGPQSSHNSRQQFKNHYNTSPISTNEYNDYRDSTDHNDTTNRLQSPNPENNLNLKETRIASQENKQSHPEHRTEPFAFEANNNHNNPEMSHQAIKNNERVDHDRWNLGTRDGSAHGSGNGSGSGSGNGNGNGSGSGHGSNSGNGSSSKNGFGSNTGKIDSESGYSSQNNHLNGHGNGNGSSMHSSNNGNGNGSSHYGSSNGHGSGNGTLHGTETSPIYSTVNNYDMSTSFNKNFQNNGTSSLNNILMNRNSGVARPSGMLNGSGLLVGASPSGDNFVDIIGERTSSRKEVRDIGPGKFGTDPRSRTQTEQGPMSEKQ